MQRKKRVTLQDVARRANVSTAVVSYVINNGPRPTSPEVRQRVLEAIEELGYHPNAFARGLRAQRTHTIGFIATDFYPFEVFTSHYCASILTGVSEELKQHDYHLLVYPMVVGEEVGQLRRLLMGGRLDGVIVRLIEDSPQTREILELIASTQMPCVCIESAPDPRYRIPAITYDDREAARRATAYLASKGHARIAHLSGDLKYPTARARLEGYMCAMQEAGLGDNVLAVGGSWEIRDAVRCTRELLTSGTPPTAIFAASDDLAIGAVVAISEVGLRIGMDIDVVGFDDIPMASQMVPPLTTVRIPLVEMGRRAVESLLGIVSGDADDPPSEVVPLTLVVRDSA